MHVGKLSYTYIWLTIFLERGRPKLLYFFIKCLFELPAGIKRMNIWYWLLEQKIFWLWNKRIARSDRSKITIKITSVLKMNNSYEIFVFFFCLIDKVVINCDSLLRMLYVYTPSQKFDTIRVSILCDIIKIWKKLTILKMSKTYILHNSLRKELDI